MGTATEHDTQPVAAAPASPGDDCGTDDLLDALRGIINDVVWRPDGPGVAALAVLGQQRIVDALRAADVVAELDRQHQPRRWSEQSDVVVCDTCQRSWPCSVRAVLDG